MGSLLVRPSVRKGLPGQDPHEEAILAAGHANDPGAFRAALKAWERTGLEAPYVHDQAGAA